MKAAVVSFFCGIALFFCVAQAIAQTPSPAPAETPKSIPPDSPKYGVYPIAYRQIIIDWLQDRLLEPGSAKFEWGEPQAGELKKKGGEALAGYSVEFKVNSRNKFGMYTGFQRYRVLIRNGEILSVDRVTK